MLILIATFILSAIFIGIAAAANAKMDTVDDHYSVSIYGKDKKKYDDMWFNSNLSWKNKHTDYDIVLQYKYLPKWIHWLIKLKPDFSPISDFWHFEKAKMIWSIIAAIAIQLFSILSGKDFTIWQAALIGFVQFALYGILWNLVFTYYYNRKLVVSPFKRKWLWLKTK